MIKKGGSLLLPAPLNHSYKLIFEAVQTHNLQRKLLE